MLVLDGVQQGFDLERGKKKGGGGKTESPFTASDSPQLFSPPPSLHGVVFSLSRSRWGTVIRILEAQSVGAHQTGSL